MASITQRSFASGELDPALHARTDLERYASGAKLMRNYIVGRNGGIAARGGFLYCAALPPVRYTVGSVSVDRIRMIDYVVDDDKNFLLVITANGSNVTELRVFKDGLPVTLTLASTFTAWALSTTYAVGDVRRVSNTVYRCKLAHTATISIQAPNDVQGYLYWDEIGLYSTDGVTIPITLDVVTTIDTIKELQFVRERGEVKVFHRYSLARSIAYDGTSGGFAVRRLDFSYQNNALQEPTVSITGTPLVGGVSWVVTAVSYAQDGSVETESLASNEVTTNIALSSEGSVRSTLNLQFNLGTIRTLSWSAIGNADAYFVYRNATGAGHFLVGVVPQGTYQFTDNGKPIVTTAGLVGKRPPYATDPFDSAGVDTSGVAAGYQQRLIVGGSVAAPDDVRGSRTAQPDTFRTSSPIVDDDEVSWRAYGVRVQRVVHLVNLGLLVMLTTDGEWIVRGGDDTILRPAEVNPEQIGYNGAARGVLPAVLETSLLYADYNAATVREIRRRGGQFEMREVSVLAAHLLRDDRIVSITVQRTPDPVIWVVTASGRLLSCTYRPDDGIVAWAQHRIGDPDSDAHQFIDVCAVPSATMPREDVLYAALRFDINSAGLVAMGSRRPVAPLTSASDRFAPMDLALRTRVAATAAASPLPDRVTGLAHLNGQVVSIVRVSGGAYTVIADPADPTKPPRTVTDGYVALTPEEYALGGTWIVGIPIVHDLETLDVDTASGRTVKETKVLVNRLGIWLRESSSVWAGLEEPSEWLGLAGLAKVEVDSFTGSADAYGHRTGYIEANLNGRFNRSGRVFLRHVSPTPLNILAVAPQGFIPQGG